MNRKKVTQALTFLIIGFMVGATSMNIFYGRIVNIQASSDLNLNPYWKVWDTITSDYVMADEIDKVDAVYGSVKGLVRSLNDPHSDYMTPDETKIFKGDLDQEIQGIGAEISLDDNLLTIITPLKKSPAELAGLKPGDKIIAINGEDATQLGLLEGITKIRGPKGTPVTLSIYREGKDDPFDVKIIRDEITVESVTAELLENEIYYVSINQFSNDTAKEFFEVVNKIILSQPKGIILDLRNNGGGYLDIAVDILGEFLPADTKVLTVKTGALKVSEDYKTTGASRLQDFKLAVLINEGSASASEILAGALQDLDRAEIIGTKSYGKGTVQEVVDLNDGSSLRLTIAKWFTPLNRDINGKGLIPDQDIKFTEGIDKQLEAAENFLLSK